MVELWLSLNVLSFKLAWRPRQPQHPNERAAVDSMPVDYHQSLTHEIDGGIEDRFLLPTFPNRNVEEDSNNLCLL